MHGENGYLLKRGLVCRPVVLAPASFLLILFLCVSRVNAATNPQSSLAINLSAVQDYSDEDPFVDYFKMSREWIPQCEVGVDAGCTWNNAWDTGEQSQIQVDANGWVKKLPLSGDSPLFSRVSTLMMVAGDPHNRYAGTYVVLYDGEGTLTYSLGGTKISGTPGRDVISVADTGNVLLTITRTDPNGTNNYIRNIRVVRQELESQLPSLVFNPTWIAKLAPFRTLRFMDWMQTNGSPQKDYANRSLATDARYTTPKGVPLEMMVKLSNTVLAEPWFTLPHRATDDYITRFATQVRDTLDARLKVYIEYSNEVWNGAFEQGAEIESWAQTEFPGGTDSGFTKRINWHGKRTADLCRLWKTVFGSQSQRVVCVLGAQAANTWTAREALDCPLWQTDPNNLNPGKSCQQQGIDAVAIAPYFGGYLGDPSIASQVRALSLDQLFREITTGGVINDPNPGDWFVIPRGGALSEAYGWMNAYDDLGVSRSIRIVAYEGGQHLVGVGSAQWDATIRGLFVQANRDTRMGAAYSSYLEYWRTGTANDRLELFSAFSLAGRYGEFGSWGALEHIEQPGSPKYDALSGFAAGRPCWWSNCAIGAGGLGQSKLTVTKSGYGVGQVTSNLPGINCGADCVEEYSSGTTVMLTAVANYGSVFAGWSGSGCSSTGSCTVTMDAAKTVTAKFDALPQSSLTIVISGSGSVISTPNGINCGAGCRFGFLPNANVALSPTASSGYIFSGWSGACTGNGICTVTMSSAKTVTANFTPIVGPDFVITGITMSSSSPAQKSLFTATVTVKNQGQVAGDAGYLDVWANQASSQPCRAEGQSHAPIGILAVGGSKTLSLSGLGSGNTGPKVLRALVDGNCTTVETNEGNNQATRSYTTSGPDLVITDIVLRPSSPQANGAFDADITIKNQGTSTANGGYLDVWSHQPTALACSTDGNGWSFIGDVAAGAVKTITLSRLPSGFTGTKTFRAFVDSRCALMESVESNNQVVKTYSVVQ